MGVFAIVEHYQGMANVSLAEGEELALRAFIMTARIVADLFPGGTYEFHGQDGDSGLPFLTMALDGFNMVSLQAVKRYDGLDDLDGTLAHTELTPLPGIDDCSSYAGMAAWLGWLYAKPSGDPEARREKVMGSWTATHMSVDYDELIPEAAKKSAKASRDKKPSGNWQELRNAVDAIQLSAGMVAKAQG